MKTKGGKSDNVKVYALLAVVVGCSVGYALWPTNNSASVGFDSDALQKLLQENERLRTAAATASNPEPVQVIAAAPAVACNCDSTAIALESAQSDKRALEKEIRDLRDEITRLKSEASLKAATQAAAASVVVAQPQSIIPVGSCAHQKLEFVRWQNDENGVAKQCKFIPENYENWEKMPPLCDYISIECLGKGNKRAAHVFGFGGPGLMIGYADVLTWEFVFARHQNLKDMMELGTMTGGTSLYFGMTANVRGGTFHSFDRSDNRASDSKRGWLPNMVFHITDILTNITPEDESTHNREVVEVLNTGRPMLALFDNGDKKKETDIYARYLAVGSILLLHDWEHLDLPRPHWEMSYSMVANTLESLGFEKAYFDFCEHIGSSTRVFIRTRQGQQTF